MSVKIRLTKRISNAKLVVAATSDHVFDAIMDTALAIENRVKGSGPTAAPFKTGTLKSAYNVVGNRGGMFADVGADPRIAPYAPHVEFGTSTQRAQPHLLPSARAEVEKHAKRIEKAMKKAASELP